MNKSLSWTMLMLYFLFSAFTLFEKKIGTSNCYDEGMSLTSVDDDHFLITGSRKCNGNPWEGFISLLNINGDSVWTKQNINLNGIVRKAPDGTFIYAGGNEANLIYDTIKLFKADLQGSIIWEKHIAFANCRNNVTDLVVRNNKILVAGISAGGNCSNLQFDSFVMSLDLDGNEDWTYHITGPGNQQIHGIDLNVNKEIICFGWADSKTGTEGTEKMLLKLDNNGNRVWKKEYGSLLNDFGYAVKTTKDNHILTLSYANQMTIEKLTSNGDSVWTKHYGAACGGNKFQITETLDHGYAFIANGTSNNQCTTFLSKISHEGEELWRKYFPAKIREFSELSDSSFILTGYSGYLPDAYIVRFDSTKLAFNDSSQYTSIYEAREESKSLNVKVYPNPATNYVIISLRNAPNETFDLSIFDMNGKEIKYFSEINKTIVKIEKASLKSGVYTYLIKGNDLSRAGRFIFE